MNQPKVAIIILNYNGLDNTIACLQSLVKITYPNYQIILVDNGSANGEADILENKFSDYITVLKNQKNEGFARGNNIGIDYARRDKAIKYICLLNNDTVVAPDFLDKAVVLIEQQSVSQQVGMVAMRMLKYHQPEEIDSLGICFTQGGLSFNIKTRPIAPSPNIGEGPTAGRRLFCPCAGAALYHRRLLEEVGCFDESFFCYAEDLDLGWRARRAGWQVVLANKAVVFHRGSASTGPMSDLAVYHTYRNIIWTLKKNLPLILFIKYLPRLLLGQLSIVVLYLCRWRGRVIVRAYWDGLFKKSGSKRKSSKKRISPSQLNKLIMPRTFLPFYLKRLFK